MDSRAGYFVEQDHSQILIIDETEKDIPVTIHRQCIGPLRLWREEILSIPVNVENSQDIGVLSGDSGGLTQLAQKQSTIRVTKKKLCFYTLEESISSKSKEYHHVAVLLEPDQTLSSVAVQTTKKMANPFSQKILQNIILAISLILNIWLMVAAQTESEFLPVITLANAGWVLSVVLVLKLIDLKQETPAIYAGLYVLAKAKFYHPKFEEFVTVNLSRILISDKIRLADQFPLRLTEEFNAALLGLVEKKEADYEAEREQRIQAERIISDQKETIARADLRMKMIEKRAYRQGILDAETPVITKAKTSEFSRHHPDITRGILIFSVAIVFWAVMRFLARSFPRFVIAVSISEFPWYAWALTFVFAYLVFRLFWDWFRGRW